jgi:hypothetical protein
VLSLRRSTLPQGSPIVRAVPVRPQSLSEKQAMMRKPLVGRPPLPTPLKTESVSTSPRVSRHAFVQQTPPSIRNNFAGCEPFDDEDTEQAVEATVSKYDPGSGDLVSLCFILLFLVAVAFSDFSQVCTWCFSIMPSSSMNLLAG